MEAILDGKVVGLDRGSQDPQADLGVGRLAIIGQEQCMAWKCLRHCLTVYCVPSVSIICPESSVVCSIPEI